MTLLSAEKIQLIRGNKTVVDYVDLTVQKKDFVGLIGPNGAGKSSLLRVLAGLIKPCHGDVILCIKERQQNIEKLSPQMRAQFVAYLAQNEKPSWPLSVKNLVALGRLPWSELAIHHSSIDSVAIGHALQVTDTEELADRPITELSGGELQRVLLARVFAGTPQLILADEPIAALDVYHQLHTMELLQQHVSNGGAVIAALHDLSLAARFCTRLVLMHHGKVIADGLPANVLTCENIEQVYGVNVSVECNEEGVLIIPKKRITKP